MAARCTFNFRFSHSMKWKQNMVTIFCTFRFYSAVVALQVHLVRPTSIVCAYVLIVHIKTLKEAMEDQEKMLTSKSVDSIQRLRFFSNSNLPGPLECYGFKCAVRFFANLNLRAEAYEIYTPFDVLFLAHYCKGNIPYKFVYF